MKKVGALLIKVQYGVSVVAALALLVMIGYEVFARYVLRSSLMGIEELMLFPIIWLYMLGGANASYEKSHIECGILTLYVKKEKSQKIFEAVKRTLCVIILTWLCYWGFFFYSYSLKTWKLADITFAPLFFANVALTVGFVLMLIYAVRDVIAAYGNLFKVLKSKGKSEERSEEK